jgi:hypothetical protein
MTMQRSKTWVASITVGAILLLGAGAGAETFRNGDGAPQATSGLAPVEAKSTREQTLTLNGHLYRVVPSTRIMDEKGNPLPLVALPVAREFRDEPHVDTAAMVEFEAIQTGTGYVLERVQLRGRMPR